MNIFTYTTKSGRLTIRESSHGFYVTDNQTGKEAACGDGTQWVSDEDSVYTEEAATRLRNDRISDEMEAAESEWVEAYFGEEVNL